MQNLCIYLIIGIRVCLAPKTLEISNACIASCSGFLSSTSDSVYQSKIKLVLEYSLRSVSVQLAHGEAGSNQSLRLHGDDLGWQGRIRLCKTLPVVLDEICAKYIGCPGSGVVSGENVAHKVCVGRNFRHFGGSDVAARGRERLSRWEPLDQCLPARPLQRGEFGEGWLFCERLTLHYPCAGKIDGQL